MFRKLSIAALLALATGAEAQRKVTAVDFCAVPTPEGSRLSVGPAGVFRLGGDLFGTAAGGQISTVANGPIFFNPVGNYMSPIRAGTCAAAAPARLGTWQAACDIDFYEPVVQRLPDLVLAAPPAGSLNFPTAAQLQAACEGAAVPTATQTGVNNALCSSQISVTENTSNQKFSKLGTSAWYNYAPAITYTLIGGYMNQNFGAVGVAGESAERYCIYWPKTNAAVGNPAGGTNKWAKPVIDTISTTMAAVNAPAGAARYADLAAATAPPPPRGLPRAGTVGPLTPPTFQETITVNYFKNYLPAGSL